MSKKSSSWSTGRAECKKGWLTVDSGIGDSQGSRENSESGDPLSQTQPEKGGKDTGRARGWDAEQREVSDMGKEFK